MSNLVQASMQMLDNYISKFSFDVNRKTVSNEPNLAIATNIEFKLINIEMKENYIIGQISLENKTSVKVKDENVAEIQVTINGLFKSDDLINTDVFEEMLKINGASLLFSFIRTYIHTTTALSGMPPIVLPLINFVEFFKNAKKLEDPNNVKKE